MRSGTRPEPNFLFMATSSQPTKILLIEDDPFLGGMYVKKLEFEHFDVSLAVDGEAGIEQAHSIQPDLILLDILLPKKDGFTVLRELKADETTKHIPVILLTNLGQKQDVVKGLNAGAVDYLIKAHFLPSEVIQKIKQHLQQV